MDLEGSEQATYLQEAVKLTRGQLLDLLLEIEDRLRVFIQAVFSQQRSDWEKLIPARIREELEGPNGSAGLKGSQLLAQATLKHLIDTMLSRWPLFQSILNDKAWVQSRLEELRKTRNELAHGMKPGHDRKIAIALLASQLGERIPALLAAPGASSTAQSSVTRGLHGKRVLWADDYPESNRWARRLLTGFGAEVVPVLDNEEAVQEATASRFDIAISDIDRGHGEPGTSLGIRLKAAGVKLPIVFFVARLDPDRPLPVGAISLSNDMTAMLTAVLSVLRPDAVPTRRLSS